MAHRERIRIRRGTQILTILAAAIAALLATPVGAAATPRWWPPEKIENRGLSSVSCPTPSFCMAVDYSSGYAVTYDGGFWGAPVDIDGTEPLTSVSCSSRSFCAAVDDEGFAMTSDGSGWSAPVDTDGDELTARTWVSCASASFCVAVSLHTGEASTYDGSSWSAPVDTGAVIPLAVSCVSESFCVVVDDRGYAKTYDGDSWSTSPYLGSQYLSSVSCPSAQFCAAVSQDGHALTFDGTSWSAPLKIDNGNEAFGQYLNSVSCASPSFCVAVDGRGYAVMYDGTSWAAPIDIDASAFITSVSCPSDQFCVAVDDDGYAVIYAENAPAGAGGSPGGAPGAPGGTVRPEAPPARAPEVTITAHPPRETAEQSAVFRFAGVPGGSYECSIDDGAWAPCRSGDAFGPLLPGDHRFRVRETLNGRTGPAAGYGWTVDLPRACVLRVARARVFVFAHQGRVRLVIRYKVYRPADVTVTYRLLGARGALALGTASSHFQTAGVFGLPESLGEKEMSRVRAATQMKVQFEIPRAPESCGRYYTKYLTIPKNVFGQTVWFQSDSVFGH